MSNLEKKVLILCTGNSCRSIIAEALINAKLDGIHADSSGVKASGRVNPNAKKLLEDKGIWKEEYHSKTIDKVIDNAYDLVVSAEQDRRFAIADRLGGGEHLLHHQIEWIGEAGDHYGLFGSFIHIYYQDPSCFESHIQSSES